MVIGGVPLLESTDGGATWTSIAQDNVHVDHHHIWINPNNPQHIINGNDGGINVTLDGGDHWTSCNSPAVGQFYAVAVDDADPYRIYGGLQDNGTWRGPSGYEASPRWHQTGDYPYDRLNGGDGMRIEVDTRDNETVYTGYQFGWYSRSNRQTGDRARLHPEHTLGETPLRWNWQTPIHLSRHHQDVLYMGSNRFHRSLDQGDNFETLSGDLTRGSKKAMCLLERSQPCTKVRCGLDGWLSGPTMASSTSAPTVDTLGKPARLLLRKPHPRRTLMGH